MIPADLPRTYSNCRPASLTLRPRFPPCLGVLEQNSSKAVAAITVATASEPGLLEWESVSQKPRVSAKGGNYDCLGNMRRLLAHIFIYAPN